MADLVLILIVALVLLWLLHSLNLGSLFGGTANAASPYIKEIGSAAQTAIQDIQKAGGNTAKSLGTLAHNVESGLFNGFASATKHSSFSVPSAKTYKQAIQSQLYPGIITGENAVTGPAASIGAGAGSALITAPSSFIQGLQSGAEAAATLPAIKALNKAVKANKWINFPSAIDTAVVHGAESAYTNVSNWVGHLF